MRFLSTPTAPVASALPVSGSAGDMLAYNNSLYCYLNGAWVALNNNITAISDVSGLSTALSGKEPTIAAGTGTQYWRGDKTWQTLDKTAVGLANVDNTSDLNKPLSTATTNALASKADLSGATFTGAVNFNNSAASLNAGVNWTGTVLNANATAAMTLAGAPQIQIGPSTSNNLAFDRFGLQARNNGVAATLNLNLLGGATSVGGSLTVTSTIAASNFSGTSSGTNTGDQTITLTGDVTGTGTGSFAATIGANKVTYGKFVAATQAAFVAASAAGNFSEVTPASARTILGLATVATSGLASDLTGTLNIAQTPAFSGGDVTKSSGSGTLTIASGAVTLAKMANLAANSIIGNNTGVSATPLALTGTQVTAMLDAFGTTTKGLVPAPSTSTGKVLSDSGTWISVAPAVSNWTPVTATGTGSSQNITLPESGLTVNDVMVTVEGLVQLPSDYTIVGTTLAITAPNTADVVVRKINASSSSGGGSSSHSYEGFGNLISLAGLTKLSGASANITFTDGVKAHKVDWSASGSNTLQLADQAQAAGAFDYYLRAVPIKTLPNQVQFGISLRNSSSGKITFIALNFDTSITVQEWTNATTFSASVYSINIPTQLRSPLWLRASSDGTTLSFYYGINGTDWELIGTRTLAAFMSSIDNVGIGVDPFAAGTVRVSNFGTVTPS